jgi:hypothetical protein
MKTPKKTSPLSVPCKKCKAPKNTLCFTDSKGSRKPHASRVKDAAVIHLTAAFKKDQLVIEKRFEAWKKKARAYVDKLGLVDGDDIFDPSDPYELLEGADTAFAIGESPKAFVRDMFAEDLASRAYDADLARQSREYGS